MAAALNMVTTRSQVVTLVSVLARQGELHGIHSAAEPGALRIQLAPLFTRLRHRH